MIPKNRDVDWAGGEGVMMILMIVPTSYIAEVVGQICRCHYRFEQSSVLSTVIKMGTIPNQSMS